MPFAFVLTKTTSSPAVPVTDITDVSAFALTPATSGCSTAPPNGR